MGIGNKVSMVRGLLQKHGAAGLVRKVLERKTDTIEKEYAADGGTYLPTEEELARQRKRSWQEPRTISIVVPAYETPELFLRQLIESVLAQTYPYWELCIADGSESRAVERVVADYGDARIRYRRLKENGGISANTNAGLAMAKGAYIGLLDHDDMLSAEALYQVADVLESDDTVQLVYTDEDKVDAAGVSHSRPHFKTDYDKELLLSYNYICHFLVFSKELLEKSGGLRPEYDGSQDYDLVLRMSEQTDAVVHISKILYHWRVHHASTAAFSAAKDYTYDAGRRALEAHIRRLGRSAAVEPVKGREYYRVRYIRTVKEPAEYRTPQELWQTTDAEYLVVYDRKAVRKITPGWEKELLLTCRETQAGIVGVRYADTGRRILDVGLNRDERGRVQCLMQGLPVWNRGYFYRAILPHQVEGVRLAAAVVRTGALRELAQEQGRTETLSAKAEDGLAFCEKLRRHGYPVLICPWITAVYKE